MFYSYNIGVKKKIFTPFFYSGVADKMEEKFYFVELYEIYKNLLTEKQNDIIFNHYVLDLSLSEIAEEKGITRQNVSDTLKNAKEKLEELERVLSIYKKNTELNKLADGLDKKTAQKIKEIINK